MKKSTSLLCVALSLLGVAFGRLNGEDPIDVRDNIVLENCEGHKMDDINYIIAPDDCCMTSDGLMGVWGCRNQNQPLEHSICLPSFGNSVIGKVGDQCGCCNGVCPSLCQCRCGGGVYVRKPFLFGFKRTQCIEEGLAEAMVLEEDGVECYTNC